MTNAGMRRRLVQWGLILAAAITPLFAQPVFDLQFDGETAKDAVSGREIELQNVVVMGSGSAAYGDLDGRGALVVASDPELTFGSQDLLWIELWINPVQFGKHGHILSKGSGANYRVSATARGEVGFSYYSKGAWRSLVSPTPLSFNEWQHVGVLFDAPAGTALLFVNGRLVARATDLPPFQSRDETPLYLGGGPLKDETYAGFVGGLGPVLIARGNPREIPGDAGEGAQVFEPESPF